MRVKKELENESIQDDFKRHAPLMSNRILKANYAHFSNNFGILSIKNWLYGQSMNHI